MNEWLNKVSRRIRESTSYLLILGCSGAGAGAVGQFHFAVFADAAHVLGDGVRECWFLYARQKSRGIGSSRLIL